MKEEKDPNDILNYLEFLKTLYCDTSPPPCEGCPFRKYCRDNNTACYDFYTYVRYDRFKPLKTWTGDVGKRFYSRKPSYKWYREVFILPKVKKEID